MTSSTSSSPVVPFSQFMEDALYHPEHGYYTANIKTVGRRGDFSTSATLHTALGTAVKAWLEAESARFPEVRDVIEVGLGDGSLMESVLPKGLLKRRRFRFHFVEASPVLRGIQKRRFGRKVRQHEDIRSALAEAGGRAFIFSNELVDAFPATVLEWDSDAMAWAEVCITEDIVTREVTRPFDCAKHLPASSAVLAWNSENPPPHPKQRVEVHFSYREWLRSWADQLTQGPC